MARGPAFTAREVFEQMLRSIPTADGATYQDVRTIYGDMSRLVVAFLATTPPAQLIEMYNKLDWQGTANGRAIHEAAKQRLLTYHPERATRLGITR